MGQYYFPFLKDVLQVQKLVKLEGIEGTEVKTEEEPKGEAIVGSGWDALRPPGMDIIYLYQIIFFLFLDVFGQWFGC